MKQVFIIGSSSAYGVGADSLGWADLVKQHYHKTMYGGRGVGEKFEVYNFCKSGATIEFVSKTFPFQLESYARSGKPVVIVSVGENNSKAEGQPEHYVSSLEDYSLDMEDLLDMLAEASARVIFVGSGSVDESKTNPKKNPLTGGLSYFSNERRSRFEARCHALCRERDIAYVNVDVSDEEWRKTYLYEDGLHPNQQGHKYIFERVLDELGI